MSVVCEVGRASGDGGYASLASAHAGNGGRLQLLALSLGHSTGKFRHFQTTGITQQSTEREREREGGKGLHAASRCRRNARLVCHDPRLTPVLPDVSDSALFRSGLFPRFILVAIADEKEWLDLNSEGHNSGSIIKTNACVPTAVAPTPYPQLLPHFLGHNLSSARVRLDRQRCTRRFAQGRISVGSFLATSFYIAAANAAFTLVRQEEAVVDYRLDDTRPLCLLYSATAA